MKKQLIQKARGGKKGKKRKKVKKSTFDSSLPYMFAWPPSLIRTQSKALWQIFILCKCYKWVSIYPLLHNSDYGMLSKPPETQDTSQNLEQNQNLKFLKLLLVSSLVFNHRMFNFEESLDYWRPHPYRTLYGCTHQFQTHQARSET